MKNKNMMNYFDYLKGEVKSLMVMGCDFYKTGHYYPGIDRYEDELERQRFYEKSDNYNPVSSNILHHSEPQLRYLANILDTDNRFHVDDVLLSRIQEYRGHSHAD